MTDEKKAAPEKLILADPEHTLYFNGFSLGVSAGDVVITFLQQGRPIQTALASYTVAKTLAEALTKAISDLEKQTGNTIMTLDHVRNQLEKGK